MTFPSFELTGEVTVEQRAFFAEFGFIVYRNVLSHSEVATMRQEAEAYQAEACAGNVPEGHLDSTTPVTYDDSGQMLFRHRLLYFTQHCPTSSKIVRDRRFDAIACGIGSHQHWLLEDTMGGVVWQMKSGRRSSAYSAIKWHVDFPTGHQLSPAFTAGIYLDESTRSNGCLALIPKSHTSYPGSAPPEPLFVEVNSGDVVCHHERILHGSGPVQREDGRRATLYLYFCCGVYPGPGVPFADTARMRDFRMLFSGT